MEQVGLSPRVRGNPLSEPPERADGRSIPACAGEPISGVIYGLLYGVYPRVCGGTCRCLSCVRESSGLSPRVRGNLIQPVLLRRRQRSIPACAGEPPAISCCAPLYAVYPRVCGGTYPRKRPPLCWAGLSPRVRGNPFPGSCPLIITGSIPACAGEPGCTSSGTAAAGVYPRVCGGTPSGCPNWRKAKGLSPRVRGNPTGHFQAVAGVWSIPACAGEPRLPMLRLARAGVYPRVCGGTRIRRRTSWTAGGLSPRVRGNQLAGTAGIQRRRSIPACAGEPLQGGRDQVVDGVYPRVCGGTHQRGPKSGPPGQVYPRVCGGTREVQSTRLCPSGLSPRVRGNQAPLRPIPQPRRSIPACAGEPTGAGAGFPAYEVYPRVCGGTLYAPFFCRPSLGLSPRVRGNPAQSLETFDDLRSIPACAGEPIPRTHRADRGRVYPRVCGGTGRTFGGMAYSAGLSPRVRGNRINRGRVVLGVRSIPACAGEPPLRWDNFTGWQVYPRVCGGTPVRP